MMHTNKMILVPHEIVGDSETSKNFLSHMDREMMKILQDSTLAHDEKLIKYQQILQRHQSAVHERDKPFQIEIREQTQPEPVFDDIIETVPKRWRKQATLLLQHVRKNPYMKWSDMGELIVDGNKIKGSNIIDLINDFSRARKTMPVIGAEIFLSKLLKDNVPRESIVNKNRFILIDAPAEIYATPQLESTPSFSITTPKRAPKRIGNGTKRWASLKL